MSEAKMLQQVAKQVNKMQKKYKVMAVPTDDELRDILKEWEAIRIIDLDSLTKQKVEEYGKRVDEIIASITAYRNKHFAH